MVEGVMGEGLEVGILGASGYTGAELLRLLGDHPRTRVACLTADRHAGRDPAEVFPHLAPYGLPRLLRIEDAPLDRLDVIFCCLPHATTQEVIKGLPRGPRVVDLSADFRLRDVDTYRQWYGHEHKAPELQREAVYGLTEIHRARIREARLVANPGCYTTTAELPLIPLLEDGLIDPDSIVVDAKSGVTGAGRSLREGLLHAEASEGFSAYGVAGHRHAPEIEQELSDAAGRPVTVTFTPHLVPMNRGIFATIYVRLGDRASAGDLQTSLARRYEGEPFVRVLPQKAMPSTAHVRGTNLCLIAVHEDRVRGRAILLSVTDNLVKGASGQALQNMNAMAGLDETTGLRQRPVFP
jgi:N-acetyl-gamma-glutamyl-phosphate reductase